MSFIRVEGLRKSFQSNAVIKGLNFELQQGRCIALVGPNGAGKTTTLRMLSGLMKPTAGQISFEGVSKNADIRAFIGYLPQHPVFYDWMTGKEFLEYVGRLAGLTKAEAKNRTLELLELVGILDAKNKRISKFSGGMRQRLGIAQALIHRPKLIMLDEPVSALDPIGRREVLQLLQHLKKETTVLFSTHILNDAEEVCDEILFLHNGVLVEAGTMEELRDKHQQAKIDFAFRENTEKYVKSLLEKGFVKSYTLEGNQASLFVENLEEAKLSILKEVVEHNLPLVKFEISRTSLEDVFMEVVQK